jgi:group I intron endonuclease
VKKYGCIYVIQNIINNKKYIGQTKQTIYKRFYQHCYENRNNMSICKAIKKYGKENFNIWIIDYADNQDSLNKLEGVYIDLFNTFNRDFGYNNQKVDLNGKYCHSEESKKRISINSSKENHKNMCRELARNQRGIPTKSKFANVYKNGKTFQVAISLGGQQKFLGRYFTEIDAAKAYDIAALNYIGNEAKLNFPELKEEYIKGKINPISSDMSINNLRGKSSKIRGVSYVERDEMWRFILRGYKTKFFKSKTEAENYAINFLKDLGYGFI